MKRQVLLLDGQNVQNISIARSLHEAGYRVTGLIDSRISFGYVSRFMDKIIGPPVADTEKYERFLYRLLEKKQYDVVLPTGDESAAFLSRRKAHIETHYGVKCAIAEFPVFDRANDKEKLMDLCREANIPHPRTHRLDAACIDEAAGYVGFPALIKPNISMGARGIAVVNSREEILAKYPAIHAAFGDCTLQEFVNHSGVYYNVMLFRDSTGDCSNYTVVKIMRYFPLKGGTSCYCEMVEDDSLVAVCRRTLECLGWTGFADFDIMEEAGTGAMKIIEINPRTPACIHGAYLSGVDFPQLIVKQALGQPLPRFVYTPGSRMRFFGLDMMWFLFSPDRFRFRPSWFRFFGRNIHYQDGSLKDPLPLFMGCISGIVKYLNPSFRKSKLDS